MQAQRLISYSFRVDEHLMAQANLVAATNDEKMAQVIRKAIRAYIDAYGKEGLPKQ